MQRRSGILSRARYCNAREGSLDYTATVVGRGLTLRPHHLTRRQRVTTESASKPPSHLRFGGFFVADRLTCCTPEAAWAFVERMTADALVTGDRIYYRLIPRAIDHAIRITQQHEAQS